MRITENKEKRIFLVTGPPGCGRDEYIKEILKDADKEYEYYHVYQYIKKIGDEEGYNITQENILIHVPHAALMDIRDRAIKQIVDEIKKSPKKIHIISTPATFRVSRSISGGVRRIDGITLEHIQMIRPTYIIIFIDDILLMKERLKSRPVLNENSDLKTLAEWRQDAIEFAEMANKKYNIANGGFLKGYIIYARDHPYDMLRFILFEIDKKYIIYVSYHMTGVDSSEFKKVRGFINKLRKHFIVMDPASIKEWELVDALDRISKEETTINITVDYELLGKKEFKGVSTKEIELAINEIRNQIVDRDFRIIDFCHAIVVYHYKEKPSAGVMLEIRRAHEQNKPMYIFYPHERRASPFLEYFAGSIKKLDKINIEDESYIGRALFWGKKEEEDKFIRIVEKDSTKWPFRPGEFISQYKMHR